MRWDLMIYIYIYIYIYIIFLYLFFFSFSISLLPMVFKGQSQHTTGKQKVFLQATTRSPSPVELIPGTQNFHPLITSETMTLPKWPFFFTYMLYIWKKRGLRQGKLTEESCSQRKDNSSRVDDCRPMVRGEVLPLFFF